MKMIIKHLVEKHYEKLKDIKYTEVFHKLKDQFEKNEYAPPTPEQAPETSTAIGFADTTRLRFRKKFLEEQKEEAWFDSDEAEDDDEDYNPNDDTENLPFTSLQEFKERNKKRRIDGDNQGTSRESPIKKQKKNRQIMEKKKQKKEHELTI